MTVMAITNGISLLAKHLAWRVPRKFLLNMIQHSLVFHGASVAQ